MTKPGITGIIKEQTDGKYQLRCSACDAEIASDCTYAELFILAPDLFSQHFTEVHETALLN